MDAPVSPGHLDASPVERWLGAAGIILLVGSLTLSPNRFFVLPFAAGGLAVSWWAVSRWGRGAAALGLAALPWLALVNLHPLAGAGRDPAGLYLSETILLPGLAVFLGRGVLARGAGAGRVSIWAAAFAGWFALAALAAWGQAGTIEVVRAWRLAFLAWGAFALGAAGGRRGARWLALSAVGVLGVLGLVTGGEVAAALGTGAVPRVGRLVGGSELLAIHLSMLLPLALALALLGGRAAGRGTRSIAWGAMAVGGAALAISFSRSAWVGGWVALVAVAALGWGFQRRRAAGLVLALMALATLVLALAVSGALPLPGVPDAYLARLRSLGVAGVLGDRAREWRLGLDAIAARPIFGSPAAPNCYNLLLQLAARSGLPILAPFVLLVVAACRRLGRALRAGVAPELAIGLLGALAGLLITGVGESSLGVRVTPIALACLGVAAGFEGAIRPGARRRAAGRPRHRGLHRGAAPDSIQ